MSDNAIINQSMMNNNDLGFLIMIILIAVIAFMSHLNRRRWVLAGGRRVCGRCRAEYIRKAKKLGLNIGEIVRTPSQDGLPCCDCKRGMQNA
jgi:hypothetical protein